MKRKAVFTRYGEISYTPADFNCWLEDFKGDLNEKERFLFSSDDWRLTEPENKHEVVEVEIPDWVPADYQPEYFKMSLIGQAMRMIGPVPKGRFHQSIVAFLRERNYLTKKQITRVLHPIWERR